MHIEGPLLLCYDGNLEAIIFSTKTFNVCGIDSGSWKELATPRTSQQTTVYKKVIRGVPS